MLTISGVHHKALNVPLFKYNMDQSNMQVHNQVLRDKHIIRINNDQFHLRSSLNKWCNHKEVDFDQNCWNSASSAHSVFMSCLSSAPSLSTMASNYRLKSSCAAKPNLLLHGIGLFVDTGLARGGSWELPGMKCDSISPSGEPPQQCLLWSWWRRANSRPPRPACLDLTSLKTPNKNLCLMRAQKFCF